MDILDAVAAESIPATDHNPPTEPSVDHHQESPKPSPETAADPGEKRKREDNETGEVVNSTAKHPLYKTSLCSFFRRQNKGECSHGDTCRFAHDESELRPRPDGSWDPGSERAKKMMKVENGDKVEVKGEERKVAEKTIMMPDFLDDNDPKLSKCLLNLPFKWKSDRLREFLTQQSVVFKSAKKKVGMTLGFVSFETEEQVESATEALNGKSVGNKTLKVSDAMPSRNQKIISENHKQSASKADPGHALDDVDNGLDAGVSISVDDGEIGDMLVGTTEAKAKSVRDVVTPLAHMAYPEQLEHKKNALMHILKKLKGNVRKACPKGPPLPEWILKSRDIGGLPCNLEGIIESPIINGYRNKCEFTFGYSVEGKPTVGFLLGNFREGVTAVQEPTDCPNVSKIACKYTSIFQDFLQSSTLPIWNRFSNKGFWRQLTVREGRNPEKTITVDGEVNNVSDVMLIVQVCSSGVDAAALDDEYKKMTQAFMNGAASNSPPLPLSFLVVQDHTGISNVAAADAPLRQLPLSADHSDSATDLADAKALNECRIHDYISNLKFSISPTAFFQVNTLGAEKLYSLAGDWADLGPDTLLFDICCGTGTIGLTLAHRVGMVVGVEMNASAVSDAQKNAEINGIKNCRFVCGKAESVIKSLLREYLRAPQDEDDEESTNFSDGENKENTKENGKDVTADKDASQGDDRNPESKTSASEAAEGENASCPVKHDEKELHNQPEKSHNSTEDIHEKKQFKNVVVIVDPPRMGLHPIVTKTLRTHEHIRRLVYISCNPETLVANAIELCTPSPLADNANKGNRGGFGWRKMSSAGLARQRAKSMPNSEPFRPIKAMGVDMFPHTSHCELVMLFER